MSGTFTELEGDARSDAELIQALRDGDDSGMDELYRRHQRMSLSFATSLAGSTLGPDLVAEAFVRILDRLRRGGGPQGAFRAYLYTTIRNVYVDHVRHHSRQMSVPDFTPLEHEFSLGDGVDDRFEHSIIQKAFLSLPERWQAALWYTTVEGESLESTGAYLGIAPNAVAVLTFRAREGLRQAYLSEHLNLSLGEECDRVLDALPKYVRGGLRDRMRSTVEEHLDACRPCAEAAVELGKVNSGLRGLLLPALLGSTTAGYLDKVLPPVTDLEVGVGTRGTAPAGDGRGVHRAGQQAVSWQKRSAALVGTAAAVGALAWVWPQADRAPRASEPPARADVPAVVPERTPGPGEPTPAGGAAQRDHRDHPAGGGVVARSVDADGRRTASWERLTLTSPSWYHLRVPVAGANEDLRIVVSTSALDAFHVHREPGYGAWDCGETDWSGPTAVQRIICTLPAGLSATADFGFDVQAATEVIVKVVSDAEGAATSVTTTVGP